MDKDSLKFYEGVKPLDLKDYKFWRKLLPKVLKVGAELEFNLNSKSGICTGFTDSCVCPDFASNSCGTTCVYLNPVNFLCTLNIRNITNCKNRKHTCFNNNCPTCENFVFVCSKSNCIEYMPNCLICNYIYSKCNQCEKRYNPNKTSEKIRKNTEMQLAATQNFGYVGKNGVLQVVSDGSLQNNGLEIPTVGRRLDFNVFKNMFDNIINVAKANDGYTDERCSFHVHILNEYYTKVNNKNGKSRNPDMDVHLHFTSFEKNMSNIILKNIMQLWRKYETAIFWLSCGLPNKDKATRWEKFRLSLLPLSPIVMSFDEIKNAIRSKVGKSRYGSLNVSNTKSDGSRLHLEFRVCDMVLSPSYMAAMCTLFYALIIKAVDISCYGLLNVEDREYLQKEIAIKNSFVNGADRDYGSSRSSDTSMLYKNKSYLANKANELIDMLHLILSGFEPAETILRKIANKPMAFRLIDALPSYKDEVDVMNSYDVEKEIAEEEVPLDLVSEDILKIIALGTITEHGSVSSWINEMSSRCNTSSETIEKHVNRLSSNGTIYWNSNMGAYLYC